MFRHMARRCPAYFLTSTMSTPQAHLPGLWLMVSHLHSGPQAHMNLPTVLKVCSRSPKTSTAVPSPTDLTLALARGFPQAQAPSLRERVWQGQLSPQLQAKTSSPALRIIRLLSG